MNSWVLLGLSALLLLVPRALTPRRRDVPEIHGFLRVLWWLNALYCAFLHRLESRGLAPLPEQGPAILIANHTCSIDPMLLQATCRRVLGFLIAREFYENRVLQPLCRLIGCIPVRRDGQDLAATRAALRALEQGRVVPLFPEGRIIPKSGRELGDPRPGVAFLVLHARVPVIPAYIWGTPETNDVWKAPVTPSHARVVYGQPIDLSDVDPGQPFDREMLGKVMERLMGAIHALRAQALGLEGTGEAPSARDPARDTCRETRRPEAGPSPLPGDRTATR